jgi:TolB protein
VSIRPDGSRPRVLVKSPAESISVFSDWSPDGRQLVFDRELAHGNVNIHLRRPGGTVVQLTDDDGRQAHPTWSPNGKRIAFESDRSGSVQVYLMRRDGSHVRQLTHLRGEALEPSYSPSGRWIAFNSHIETRNGRIFVIRPSGERQRQLTTGRSASRTSSPRTPPNGRLIAFSSFGRDGHADQDADIWMMRSDGTHLRDVAAARQVFDIGVTWRLRRDAS